MTTESHFFTPTPQTTIEQFKRAVESITDHRELTHVRETLRASQRWGSNVAGLTALIHPKYGLSLCYKKLDERAGQLGFYKFSTGYLPPNR